MRRDIDHDIDTIIIDPNDVADAMQHDAERLRNGRHVLQVTPPLEGEVEAKLYFDEQGTFYGGDGTKPVHIRPAAFLSGSTRDPQIPEEAAYPDKGYNRALFRDEYGLEEGEVIEEDYADEWDEWWSVTIENWRAEVKHRIVDELEFDGDTVDVRTRE